ncbi:hypothetical protein Aph02nite_77060 [Actinoplanes philippinensis]|uniref:DNA-binding transcriptional activator of the SARP family n=1 Tax=Actinoplanes philippinensis TaxID=35752 RepID=A0A1I2HG68_9ACTN|nr:BTAD domain-containing putative transcriptional regulator [Actinoplanes philippinensis]GIE81756.1 hypothetical protein Aph02nite_77060 [Actinoplanes philippinensis]SFF28528.1 DNA-binding transcriptional activator of the SARP family [Actinoplanes philippinensis]
MVDVVREFPTFSVLGPVRAWRAGAEIDLGSPQQRTTLAMLLLNERAVATLDELIKGMWGDQPPRSAGTTIRTYISRLRAVLGAGSRLVSIGGGYALDVPPEALDLARFQRHTARGAVAARCGDHDAAAREQTAALALWHGQPLAGTSGPYAGWQQSRLQQLVDTARVDLLTAQLALGRHREVLPEAVAMAAANPLWEDAQTLTMQALYGSGRIAEALEHYRRVRRNLLDELGLEPGPRMRDVHRRILAGDPSLAPAPPAATAPAPARRRPVRRTLSSRAGTHLARTSLRRVG